MEFAYQSLNVWQKAMDYSNEVIDLSEELNTDYNHFKLIEQLESSTTSIAVNIAEGKGRNSKKEFIRHLYIARGSLYESVSMLELFHLRNWITEKQLKEKKKQALEITKMLMGLIKKLSENNNTKN